ALQFFDELVQRSPRTNNEICNQGDFSAVGLVVLEPLDPRQPIRKHSRNNARYGPAMTADLRLEQPHDAQARAFDVVVAGCGIAGLSAAVAASQTGAHVAVLERATRDERGGNTRWTEALMRVKSETEVSDDFEDHLANNAGHHLDPELIAETSRAQRDWPAIVKTLGL